MDSLGAQGMSAFQNDPKTQVMRQVQQEAAMQNARMLVEVHTYIYLLIPFLFSHFFLFPFTTGSLLILAV
jgi:hypothetical protein